MPKNLTPAHLRCWPGQCPSVHQLADGRLRIVGKIDPMLTVNEDGSPVDPSAWDGIGQDETAIIISPDFLDDYVAGKVKEIDIELTAKLRAEGEIAADEFIRRGDDA